MQPGGGASPNLQPGGGASPNLQDGGEVGEEVGDLGSGGIWDRRLPASGAFAKIAPARLPRGEAVEGGHALALGVKGSFGDAGQEVIQVRFVHALAVACHDQRNLGGVAQDIGRVFGQGDAGLGIIGEGRARQQQFQPWSLFELGDGQGRSPGQFELRARNVQHGHSHAVLGERARLVRADGRHRAERLHRGQLADQRVAREHALCSQRERDGDSGGQTFGHSRHGQTDGRKQQQVQGIAAQ